MVTHKIEERRREREEKEKSAKNRYHERESTSERTAHHNSSSSNDSQSEDECKPSTSATRAATKRKMKPENIILKSAKVIAALDRVNLPDRGAVFVVGAVAQALGHDLTDIALSRSTVRKSRIERRKEAAQKEMDEFSMEGPLLQWDLKSEGLYLIQLLVIQDYIGELVSG